MADRVAPGVQLAKTVEPSGRPAVAQPRDSPDVEIEPGEVTVDRLGPGVPAVKAAPIGVPASKHRSIRRWGGVNKGFAASVWRSRQKSC